VTSPFGRQVYMSCSAMVGGRELRVEQLVVEEVYDDLAARKAVEAHLRHQLMMKILERWTPKIKVRRN